MKPCVFPQTSMIDFCGATGATRSREWCFSIESPSVNLGDLSLRCEGCETVSSVVGLRSDHARIGSALYMGCHQCFVHLQSTDKISL